MEDDLKQNNGRRPEKKWKTTSKKIENNLKKTTTTKIEDDLKKKIKTKYFFLN